MRPDTAPRSSAKCDDGRELRERWVALMRAWAQHAPGQEPDFKSVRILRLRRVEPPFDLARDAIDDAYRKLKERDR